MSRRIARRHACNLIFQIEFHTDFNLDEIFQLYLDNIEEISDIDKTFIYKEFSGVYQNLEKIDNIIEENLDGGIMYRLNKTDLAILRLAIYEIYFDKDIPDSVSINEAVELAKEFSVGDSPSFVNGVLGNVIRSLEV